MNKNIQLLRNSALVDNRAAAVNKLQSFASGTTLLDGQPLICRYKATITEGDPAEEKTVVKALFGIYNAATEGHIATVTIIDESNSTVIPDAVQEAIDAINASITELNGKISQEVTDRTNADTAIQTELDATQVGAGLNADGSYDKDLTDDILSGDSVTSLYTADKALANAIRDVKASVSKNHIEAADDSIAVDTTAADKTTIKVNVKSGDNALVLDENNGLYVDKAALTTYEGVNAISIADKADATYVKEVSLVIDPTDKVLSQSTNGLLSSISISAVTGDELTALGTNVKEAYKLVGVDGTERLGEAIKIYKDSSLKSVELVEQKLVFTYILNDGTESTVEVDVSNFLAESEFKDGLIVTDSVVKVLLDAGNENAFLSVSEAGLKLSGVQTAIDAAVLVETNRATAAENKIEASVGLDEDGSHITTTGNYTSTATTITGEIAALDAQAKVNADAIAANKTTIDAYTVNTKAISENPVLNGADIKLDGYVKSELQNEANEIAATDTVNIAFGKIAKTIYDNEETTARALTQIKETIGFEKNAEYVANTGATYISTANSLNNADVLLDAAIKAVENKVDNATAAAISVKAGNGINIAKSGINNTVNTVSVKLDATKVDTTEENALTNGAYGLYLSKNWDCGTY